MEHILEDANLFLDSLNGNKILDLGSGPGRDSLFFKESDFKPVCLDISKEMIKLCREKSLMGVIGDLENLCFKNNSFDAVICMDVLYHKDVDPKSAVEEIFRVLKNGGIGEKSAQSGEKRRN